MGESRAASRWHAPPGPRRSRLPRGRALTWACSVGLLLLFGLRGLLLGPGGAWQRMFGRVRTHPSLLLQHYNARQLLFRRDGKRVYFLHIHKAAGSTLCQLAMDAGELVNRENNCNLQEAPKRALAVGHAATQCATFRHSAVSFIANERGLPNEAHFEPGGLYVAVLREPRARYLSQYLHLKLYGEAYLRGEHPKWPGELRHMRITPHDGVPPLATLLAGRNNRIPAGFRDSFQTRALAGASTHGLPDGGTTAEHLAAAKARLELFDLVLTVESLDDDVALLAAAAGWSPPNMTAGRRGSKSNSDAQLAALDARTRELLEAKVVYDDELYQHARALAAKARARFAAGQPLVAPPRQFAPKCAQLQADAAALKTLSHTPGGPYGNWSYGCRHDAEPTIAACAVVRDGGADLRFWLVGLRAAGVGRVFLHDDGSTDDTQQVLRPFVESGFVMMLQAAYPPPRYGISEPASGAPWAGYREVLGRCLTQAMLEHMCWLLHLAVGQMPNGPFVPPAVTPRDQNNNVLPLYSRYMCLRPWPSQEDPNAPPPAPKPPLPPGYAPWLLNVPVAFGELAARGPHAVVGQAGSIMGRASCTKCRGMNPLLGLQDRFTPEVDPCVAYYDTDHARRKNRTWCVQDWCAGAPAIPVALDWV